MSPSILARCRAPYRRRDTSSRCGQLIRRRQAEDDQPRRRRHPKELGDVAPHELPVGEVLEDEARVDEVELAVTELAEVGAPVDAELAAVEVGVQRPCGLDHSLRDVDADGRLEARRPGPA